MNIEKQPKPYEPTSSLRRAGIYAGLVLVAFLCGFVPMWLLSREASSNLSRAEHHLSIARIENTLASAVIDARRGDYEPARQSASDFFTSLRAETESGTDSIFSRTQQEALQPLFGGRDEIITLIARGDPASADRLSDLYVSCRKIIRG